MLGWAAKVSSMRRSSLLSNIAVPCSPEGCTERMPILSSDVIVLRVVWLTEPPQPCCHPFDSAHSHWVQSIQNVAGDKINSMSISVAAFVGSTLTSHFITGLPEHWTVFEHRGFSPSPRHRAACSCPSTPCSARDILHSERLKLNPEAVSGVR